MPDDRPRILIVAPGGSFFTDPFRRAFERAGYACEVFDHRQGVVYTNVVVRKMIKRFRWLKVLKRYQIAQTNRSLLKTVARYKPRYLFVQKGESLYPETIAHIGMLGVTTMGFYNDMMNQWDYISHVASEYHFFFTVDELVLQRLRTELGLQNCFSLSLAAEPLPDPFTRRQDEFSVAFIGQPGNGHSNREKLLESVSDLGLNIWGTEGWTKTSLAPRFRGPSSGEQRFGIYNHSKIVLDTTWDALPTDFVSNRAFEAMGCGALYMTDSNGQAIREAYVEGQEMVLFRNERELREKVQYYLTHEDERVKIARAGHAKTVALHTYDARVRHLLEISVPSVYSMASNLGIST